MTGEQIAAQPPRPAGDTVLAPTDPVTTKVVMPDGGEYLYLSPRNTVALDARTGKELWRTAGNAMPSAGTGTALVVGDGELRVVRLRDGGEIWRRSTAPLAGWTPLPDYLHPETIATAGQDGLLSVFGYADGKLRATSKVPWETKTRSATLIPAGPNLAVIRDDPSRDSTTTVYSADDLEPLWTAGYLSPCGELLCSVAIDGVAGRDPATGHEVWTAPAARNMFPVGGDRVLLAQNIDAVRGAAHRQPHRPGPRAAGHRGEAYNSTWTTAFISYGRASTRRDGSWSPGSTSPTAPSPRSACSARAAAAVVLRGDARSPGLPARRRPARAWLVGRFRPRLSSVSPASRACRSASASASSTPSSSPPSDQIEVVRGVADPVVGDPVLRVVVRADPLRPVDRTDLGLARVGGGRVRLLLRDGQQPGAQDAHRRLLVLQLALLVLAAHHGAGGEVGDPYGGVGGVDRLAARPGRAEHVDPQVFRPRS